MPLYILDGFRQGQRNAGLCAELFIYPLRVIDEYQDGNKFFVEVDRLKW